MSEEYEVLNETLVEKIFNQFEDIKIDDLYNGDFKFVEKFIRLCGENKIRIREIQIDKKYNRISGSYAESSDPDYDYEIRIYKPKRDKYNDQDVRDYINSLLHEFTHLIILKGIKELPPHINKSWITARFTNSIIPHGFDIKQITKESATNFLNYIFDITEKAVFAFSIAYSCHLYRDKEDSDTLFNTNKKYILNYENGKISNEAMDSYIEQLQDEKLFLFKVQYAVYFLSEHKYILKLDSFMNLIKKYEKRFDKMFQKFGG